MKRRIFRRCSTFALLIVTSCAHDLQQSSLSITGVAMSRYATRSGLSLTVDVNTDWGDNINGVQVQELALLAASQIWPYIQDHPPVFLRVRPSDDDIPHFLYTGEVQLSARGKEPWKFVYQFAHELCHVAAFNGQVAQEHLTWFEEVFAEDCSLYALRHLGRRQSADFQVEESDFVRGTLPEWFRAHRHALETKPVAETRRLIGTVARAILPLIETDPSQLNAIAYLRGMPASKTEWGSDLGQVSFRTLEEQLQSWYSSVPELHREFVAKVGMALGIEVTPSSRPISDTSTPLRGTISWTATDVTTRFNSDIRGPLSDQQELDKVFPLQDRSWAFGIDGEIGRYACSMNKDGITGTASGLALSVYTRVRETGFWPGVRLRWTSSISILDKTPSPFSLRPLNRICG
jgi:hypothetical protein